MMKKKSWIGYIGKQFMPKRGFSKDGFRGFILNRTTWNVSNAIEVRITIEEIAKRPKTGRGSR